MARKAPRRSPGPKVAQQAVDNVMDDIRQLDRLHPRATKFMTTRRSIGQLLHADLIGVSSDEPDGFTIDWAASQGGHCLHRYVPHLAHDNVYLLLLSHRGQD